MLLGVLKSEEQLWPEFKEVLPETQLRVVDDIEVRLNRSLREIPRSVQMMIRNQDLPKRHLIVVSRLYQQRVSTLLSTDRPISLLNTIAKTCPHIRQFMVAHTAIQPLNEPRISQTFPFSNRTLLVWGERDLRIVRSIQPLIDVRVNGSIRNAGFLQRAAELDVGEPMSRICLISSYLGNTKEDSRRLKPSDLRYILREQLLEFARVSSHALGLPLHVALKPPTMGLFPEGNLQKFQDEREYFCNRLEGIELTFTDPDTRYATYVATRKSKLTIGLPTGTLIETFGRGELALGLDSGDSPEFSRLPPKLRIDKLEAKHVKLGVESRLRGDASEISHEARDWIHDANSTGPIERLRSLIQS